MAEFYRNNPDAILDHCVDKSPENIEKSIAEGVCKMLGWSLDTPLRVSPLTGGITNELYLVRPQEDSSSEQFVVRMFGEGTDLFIDRNIENFIFASLSKVGVAPPFIGLFGNGRVEGYLDATSLSPDDFSSSDMVPCIAKALANLHTVDIDMDHSVAIWSKLDNFFSLAKEALNDGRLSLVCSGMDLNVMIKEREWLESALGEFHKRQNEHTDSMEYSRGCVFGFQSVLCHNDLLSGNVLRHNKSPTAEPKLTIIDYEYVCYNYRAFDIANHFCEHAGFDFDIENKFPNKEGTRRLFLEEYTCSVLKVDSTQGISREFLDGLDDTIMRFTLLSHLFWGSWALVQASCSNIDFDFSGYAKKRFCGYFYHKNMCISM